MGTAHARYVPTNEAIYQFTLVVLASQGVHRLTRQPNRHRRIPVRPRPSTFTLAHFKSSIVRL